MITPNQYLWMRWHKQNPNGTWEEYMNRTVEEHLAFWREEFRVTGSEESAKMCEYYYSMTPRNRSGGKESRTRDLDHIMGSRFKERTGQDKQWITEREWQEQKKKNEQPDTKTENSSQEVE
jgi:hypothetical protein